MGLISLQQPILEPLKEDFLKQHERNEELDFQVLIFQNLKDRTHQHKFAIKMSLK